MTIDFKHIHVIKLSPHLKVMLHGTIRNEMLQRCVELKIVVAIVSCNITLRESKTVLDTEFHAVDSGFQSLVGFWIL